MAKLVPYDMYSFESLMKEYIEVLGEYFDQHQDNEKYIEALDDFLVTQLKPLWILGYISDIFYDRMQESVFNLKSDLEEKSKWKV